MMEELRLKLEQAIEMYGTMDKRVLEISQKLDIEILNDEKGRPYVNILNNKIQNIEDIDISLSHCKEYAIANVVVIFK